MKFEFTNIDIIVQFEYWKDFHNFRWLTLLLSQEFPLPDVERIWDTLFSDSNRFQFLIHVCCAMVMLVFLNCLQLILFTLYNKYL